MHPLNNKNFGANNITVFYHNGSALVTGYVVKQIGTTRFVVTTDGTTTFVRNLAQTDAHARMLDGTDALTLGQVADKCTMTVTIASTTHYVKKLFTETFVNTAGVVYPYALNNRNGTAAVNPLTARVPVNTVAPAITGTAKVGMTLTVSNGTWNNSPTSYTRAWFADGVVIAGATAATYVPVTGDIGKVITATVTAVKTGLTPKGVTTAPTAAVIA